MHIHAGARTHTYMYRRYNVSLKSSECGTYIPLYTYIAADGCQYIET